MTITNRGINWEMIFLVFLFSLAAAMLANFLTRTVTIDSAGNKVSESKPHLNV